MKLRYKLNTAARLVAAILMGLTFLVVLATHEAVQTEIGGSLPPYFIYYNALVCAIVGWNTLGSEPGYGGAVSIASGLRTMCLAFVISCLLFGMVFIINALINGDYLDPIKTIFDWFRISFDFLVELLGWQVIAVAILGGALSGRLTGMANARWP